MTRRLPLAAASGLAALGLLAGAGTAGLWLPEQTIGTAAPVSTTANPTSATLACPPGVLDSFEPTNPAAPAGIWSSTGLGVGDEAPETLTATANSGKALDLPTGVVVAGQGGGELLGLSTTSCAVPSTDQWLVIGPTTLGDDALLVLTNPSDAPSVAQITGYGAAGLLDDAPQRVTVPAHSSVNVLPAGWYADEERLALRIRADGGGVAAFAQLSRMSGETPLGASWISASSPAASQTILGVGGEASATLRLVVPGDAPATARIRLLTASGAQDLEGGAATIDAGTVLDIPLDGASAEPIAVSIDSDEPVVASIEEEWSGGAWPGSDAHWGILSALVPSTSLTSAQIPGADSLGKIVSSQLGAAPLRATSVATNSGGSDPTTKLLLALPEDSTDGSVDVEVGGQSKTVAAGSSVLLDLPNADSRITASGAVRAAILLTARTPNGTVRATWPIGTTGLAARESLVTVGP